MLAKLKSVLLDPRLLLALKAIAFGGALLELKHFGFSWLPITTFLIVSFFLFGRVRSGAALVLVLLGVATIGILDASLFLTAAAILCAALFYLIAGLKTLTLADRPDTVLLRNLLLFYLLFTLFFIQDKSGYFALTLVTTSGLAFLIFYDWIFDWVGGFPKRHFLAAGVASFIVAESLWGTALLPLGVINSANLLLLITYILTDFLKNYFQGTLNRQHIIKNGVLFVILFLVVLLTSAWRL